MSQYHDICVSPRIQGVLVPPQVVCGVVDSNRLVPIHAIVDEDYRITLVIGKAHFVATEGLAGKLGKDVVLQSRHEILM